MSYDISKITDTLKKTLVYDTKETSVFLIGSASPLGGLSFRAGLSDIDLLVAPVCHSLKDYVAHLDEVLQLSKAVNYDSSQPVDLFMVTKRIIPLHFAYLSVLTGTKSVAGESTLMGPIIVNSGLEASVVIDAVLLKRVYRAEALRLCREYQESSPVADTGKARKTIKSLLRTLKVLICALAPVDDLTSIEETLLTIRNLHPLKVMIDNMIDEHIPIGDVLEDALVTEKVADWSAWMIAQEELSYWFAGIESLIILNNLEERRLYEGIARVRDMLFPGLRNIIFEKDENTRLGLISDYADNVSSVIAKLGLAGVSDLLDFTTRSTPSIVRRSYDVLVEHLTNNRPSLECLASSIVLLEFALECSTSTSVHS